MGKKCFEIILLFSFSLILCFFVYADNDPKSFSIYHEIDVASSVEYKFLDSSEVAISAADIEYGTNAIGGLYSIYNATQTINLSLSWTPLLLRGATEVTSSTAYPYEMTIKDSEGSTLPTYASYSAGGEAGSSEFVVYGDYGSGTAYFLKKRLQKDSSGETDTSKICTMSIVLKEELSPGPGTYDATIRFDILGP